MKTILLLITITLTGCLPEEPHVPTKATCTADNWRVDPETNEIITDDQGAAIQCVFI